MPPDTDDESGEGGQDLPFDDGDGENWACCRLAQLLQADPPDEVHAVLLQEDGGRRAFPIHIGPGEWQAIHRPVHGVEMARPMTHDLLVACLEALDARPVAARIRDLAGAGDGPGVFLGSLVLRRGDEAIEMDCRPSDAIAVAVRCGCPIQVARHVLDQVAGEEDG